MAEETENRRWNWDFIVGQDLLTNWKWGGGEEGVRERKQTRVAFH